ncbi:MAG: hypothetical protein HY594_02250 [Candidatus Omnitrophica bacterium]|nr:hypothetical protein [Candidatus Omnitrophota bacterium]
MTPADFARYRYKQILRHRLERAIGYPAGQQPGRVALSLTVRRDGQIQQAACEEGRSSLLGKAAVEGVARAQPFPRFPEDLPSDRETYEFLIAFEPAGNSSVSP